jgi:uncharacterized DUF497 family protein
MLGHLNGFDWDEHNVSHIGRHGVVPIEVEEVTDRPHVIIPAASRGGEARWKLFGRTMEGRFLVVVFTIRADRMRPITAYSMNQIERKLYGPQISD